MEVQRPLTTFEQLPELVLERVFRILQCDPDANLKNSRLVSRNWYIFLATHDFKMRGRVTTNDDSPATATGPAKESASLQTLEAFYQPELAELTFNNCAKPLPILSSTRVKIPSAENVVIKDGVSEDNLRALLRCYCSTASTKVLTLINHCFANCGADFMKTNPKQAFRFPYLTTINLICGLQMSPQSATHWNAMNIFLAHVEIAKLKSISLRQNCFTPTAEDGGIGDENAITSWANFIRALGTFVTNHAAHIKSVHVCLLASRYGHISSLLPALNVLTNLEEFRFSYTGSKSNMLRMIGNREEKLQVNAEFTKLVQCLSRLRTFVLMTADQELNLNQLFTHASPKINAISLYVRGFNSLAWVHQHARQNKGSNVELLDLYFSVRNNPFREILNNAPASLPYRLTSLRELKLLMFRDSTRPPVTPVEAVYEECVDWIFQFTPNVRQLQFSFYADQAMPHELTLDQMKRLISDMACLEELSWTQVLNYGVPQGQELRRPRVDLDADPKVQQLRDWVAQSTNQRGVTISVRRAKNYHYTNFADGTDELACVRINRAAFKVY